VERAGPSNGGALSTAGGVVFQGTGSGEFTALDAKTGSPLWSSPTQTGVIAAPMSYAIDGKQYVAIMVGTGGSWAMIGGDGNTEGQPAAQYFKIACVCHWRYGAASAGSAASGAQTHGAAATASGDVGKGAVAYHTYCGNCHGVGAINLGILPDLRYSTALLTEEAWRNIVLGGALEDEGMASFKPVLDNEAAESIRAFVIAQAQCGKVAVDFTAHRGWCRHRRVYHHECR
jgi:mono/diheme cytochrome c family protein